jgi:hypothetical protein
VGQPARLIVIGRPNRIADLLLGLRSLYKLGLCTGRQPFISTLLQPVFSSRLHQVTMLPIYEPIELGQQSVLPCTLLQELMKRALRAGPALLLQVVQLLAGVT